MEAEKLKEKIEVHPHISREREGWEEVRERREVVENRESEGREERERGESKRRERGRGERKERE